MLKQSWGYCQMICVTFGWMQLEGRRRLQMLPIFELLWCRRRSRPRSPPQNLGQRLLQVWSVLDEYSMQPRGWQKLMLSGILADSRELAEHLLFFGLPLKGARALAATFVFAGAMIAVAGNEVEGLQKLEGGVLLKML